MMSCFECDINYTRSARYTKTLNMRTSRGSVLQTCVAIAVWTWIAIMGAKAQNVSTSVKHNGVPVVNGSTITLPFEYSPLYLQNFKVNITSTSTADLATCAFSIWFGDNGGYDHSYRGLVSTFSSSNYGSCSGNSCLYSLNMTANGILVNDYNSTYPLSIFAYGPSVASLKGPSPNVMYLEFHTQNDTFLFTIARTGLPPAGINPQPVYINNGPPVSGSVNPDSTNMVSSVTDSLNITVTMTKFQLTNPVKPLGIVLYVDYPGTDTLLRGAQYVCTTATGSSSLQDCGDGLVTTSMFSFMSRMTATAIMVDRIDVPVVSDLTNVTFSLNFARRSFDIVSPAGSTMSVYSSDVERVFFYFGNKPYRKNTTFYMLFSDFLTPEQLRNSKITVMMPDQNYPLALRTFTTIGADLSATKYPLVQTTITYPCPGAGNETLNATCDGCDTTRFNPDLPTLGRQYACGQCQPGHYGNFCQFTNPFECQVQQCGSFGQCDRQVRDCICNAPAFAANPANFRYGHQCEYTPERCAKEICNGHAICLYYDPWQMGSPVNTTDPICSCGVMDKGLFVVSRQTYESNCTECGPGAANSSLGVCDQCKPGYYGTNCQYTNATECGSRPSVCNGGVGDCAYIFDMGKHPNPVCNCSNSTAGTMCGASGCGDSVVRISTYGEPDRFYCPRNISCTNSSYFSDWKAVFNYMRTPESGCYLCPNNTRWISYGSTSVWPEQCIGCISGLYGPFCNYTSPTVCGATECSGHGVCSEDNQWTSGTFVCNCDAGYAGYNCANTTEQINQLYCSGNGTALVRYQYQAADPTVTCFCNPGSYGADCSMNATTCKTTVCGDTGNCGQVVPPLYYAPTKNAFCECIDDRYGGSCSEYGANDAVCSGHGQFRQYWTGEWNCTCSAGYHGLRCESTVNQCRNEFCNANGDCLPINTTSPIFAIYYGKATPNCSCDIGWTGTFCDLIGSTFALVDASAVDQSIVDPMLQPLLAAAISNSTLTDYGQPPSNTLQNSPDIVSADISAGVAFVFSPTPDTTILQSVRSYNGFGTIFKRLSMAQVARRAHIQMQSVSEPNVFVRCSMGTTVGELASGLNLTLSAHDVICVDIGDETTGCLNKTAPGYINTTALSVVTLTGEVLPCSVVTIKEIASNHSVTVVAARQSTAFAIGKTAYSVPSEYQKDPDVVVINGFSSQNGSLQYIVGRNISTALTDADTALFVDIWRGDLYSSEYLLELIANGSDFANITVNLTYVTRQYLTNPYIAYDGMRAIWAPISQRLIVRNPRTHWNMIPLNPDTGLFETGFIIAQVMPGNDFDPWRDEVMYDSPDLIMLSTFGETVTGITVAYPMVVNITLLNRGLVSQAVHRLHPTVTGGIQPSALSSIFSPTQIHIEAPKRVVSVILIQRRVVLALEMLTDTKEPSYKGKYIGLLCALPYGADVLSTASELCTDFNTQLDPGFFADALSTTLVPNPLLDDVQYIAQIPDTYQAVDAPMVIFAIRPTHLVSWTVSATSNASANGSGTAIVTKRIEEVNMTLLDPAITNCTRASFMYNGTMLVVICQRVIACFAVNPQSYKLSYITKHLTTNSTGRIVTLQDSSHIVAVASDMRDMTVYKSIRAAAAAPTLSVVETGAFRPIPSSSSSKTTLIIALSSGIGGGLLLIGLIVFIIYRNKKHSEDMARAARAIRTGEIEMDERRTSDDPAVRLLQSNRSKTRGNGGRRTNN